MRESILGYVLLLVICEIATPVLAHPPIDLALPAQPFCIVVIAPQDGFRMVRITVDQELSPPSKLSSWQVADGDSNGWVTPAEGRAFEDATLQLWAGGLGMGNESLALQADASRGVRTSYYAAVRPMYAITWRHIGHGFYEDATSSHTGSDKDATIGYNAFETQQVREYGFQVTDEVTSVELSGANEAMLRGLESNISVESQSVEEYVVVQAPAGWVVAKVTGQNYTGQFIRRGTTERMDLQGFDTAAPWTIQFVKARRSSEPTTTSAPGLQALALIAVCLGAAWSARRNVR